MTLSTKSFRRTVTVAATLAAAAISTAFVANISVAAVPHLKLTRAFPSADTTLTTAPDAVRLWLSEPAALPGSKISVADAKGTVVPVTALTRGAKADDPIVGKFVTPPGNGVYTITWKAMSKDGHVVNGTIPFTVRTGK